MPADGREPGPLAGPAIAGTAQAVTAYDDSVMRVFLGLRSQVREVRSFVTEVLERHPAADEVMLLASEIAANAVVHTASGKGGTFTVLIRSDEHAILVEVHDDGSDTVPAACPASQPVESGRGLGLVDRLADRWGHLGGRDGRVVWFEVER